ncbi:MAG: SDR family oxidoreductase [Opitutales bacterium]|nr:SDR family oxidoreductase [Opitutales bacterium]
MEEHCVVISGCTRGLGLSMSREFAAGGYAVAGFGRNEAALAGLRESLGPQHLFEALDVTDDAAVKRFADMVLDRFGPPAYVINNAAVINTPAPIWEVSDDAMADLLAVNIKGTVSVMRQFLPALNAAGRGVVVNFSSGWGRSTSPEVAPYCASKWAIEGLSKAVAKEVAAGVSVVALNPGIIDTEMLREAFGDSASAYDDAETWAKRAVPRILRLGPADNGASASVD